MKKSVLIAFLILFGLLAYFGVRAGLRQDAAEAAPVNNVRSVSDVEREADRTRPTVVTRRLIAEPHPVFLTLKGRTIPNRTVTVRSGTTGSVISAPALEGKIVGEGTILCRLGVDARQANIDEAEALLAAQQAEFDASQQLVSKGLAASNRLNMAKANLDAARAAVDVAKIELTRTEIRAPFSGVFEQRMAERGDFLTPGGPCGIIADLNPLRVEAEIAEEYAIALKQGAPVSISVLGATPRQGEISYVARTATDATRTFKIEANLSNPNAEISAGITSDLKIQLGETLATAITPALLTLHDDGRLGVRYVNEDDIVSFAEVSVIDDETDRIWVSGLPETVHAVSVGQDYISEGARVVPSPEGGARP